VAVDLPPPGLRGCQFLGNKEKEEEIVYTRDVMAIFAPWAITLAPQIILADGP
jgi:hypothetical protein